MEPDYNNNYQNNFQSGFQPNGFDDLHLDDEIYEIKSDRINPEDFYQHSRKKRYSEVSLRNMPVVLIIILANLLAGIMCIIAGSDHFETGGLRYADAGRCDLHAAHRDHLPLPAEELCQRHHGCSQVMDERTYCLTPEQWRHAKACLTLAKRWGLIGDDSPEALERRRAAKNAQAERAEQDGKPVYGTRRFSAPAYLQYELTRFKLDFAEPCEKIRALGICPDFTDAQTRAWYDANPDLFTRYAGDSFPYEEVKQIIEKRMREEVYDSLVQDLLRGPADRP